MASKERLDIHPGILAQAAEWFAVLGSDRVSRTEKEQWRIWLAAHPDHRAAWARVEHFTGKFQNLPTQAASAALNSPDLSRRRSLKTLTAVGITALCGWQFSRSRYWQQWTADYQTDLGVSKTFVLADGSKMILDAGSAVNVEFTPQLRRLTLVSGEIYIETASDRNGRRPLLVDCREGRVRALGTRFSVSQQPGRSVVTVFADAVEIQPGGMAVSGQILQAGQTTQFTQAGIEPIRSAESARPAWAQGILPADNLPLSEFLLQLNRYRHGFITCAPEIAGLRIVGSFPLNDTDRILATLEQTLPVRISRPMPLWVKVIPR